MPSTSESHLKQGWALISDEACRVFEIIVHIGLAGTLTLFGVSSNMVNIVIFRRQGLTNSINISLFMLAVTDLCSLIFLGWRAFCLNPFIKKAYLPFLPSEVEYLTGGGPQRVFSRNTCWITLFISTERLLCIITPLKVKQIITPGRSKLAIGCIYLIVISAVVPEYATVFLSLKYSSELNRTIVGIVYSPDRKNMEGLVFVIGAVLHLSAFFTNIVIAALLIISLRRQTKWRESSNLVQQSEGISSRDKKTIKMIALLASFLIICFTPGAILEIAVFCVPVFSPTGIYSNLFNLTWSVAFLFEAINATANIFIYYFMSSKYRQTLHELFQFKHGKV